MESGTGMESRGRMSRKGNIKNVYAYANIYFIVQPLSFKLKEENSRNKERCQ